MSSINSPLGRMKMAQATQRTLSVPDETEPLEDLQKIKQTREQIASSQKILSPDARERLNYLANLGRKTEEVEVEGITFTLRTLKAKENAEAIHFGSSLGEPSINQTIDSYHSMRNYTMSKAIQAIDGISLENVVGSRDTEVIIKHLLEEMDEAVIDYLYGKFLTMTKNHKEKFSIKSQEEVKEVIEDIKK